MKKIPRQIYTKEFKAEAVRLVREDGLSVSEAARRLSVPNQTFSKWLSKERSG